MNTKKTSVQWLFGNLPSMYCQIVNFIIRLIYKLILIGGSQDDENFEDISNTVDHTILSGATFRSEDNSLDTDQTNDLYDELDEDDIQTCIVDMKQCYMSRIYHRDMLLLRM